jgi:hypothetical protein
MDKYPGNPVDSGIEILHPQEKRGELILLTDLLT